MMQWAMESIDHLSLPHTFFKAPLPDTQNQSLAKTLSNCCKMAQDQNKKQQSRVLEQ
jgi:hypothetical protein